MRLAIAFTVVLSLVFVSAGQAAVTSNTWMPSSFVFFDQCTGENVAISGDVHVLMTSTVSGDRISGTIHSTFIASGMGQTSGLVYHETVTANGSFSTSLVNGQATQTFVGRIRVVAPGGQNNQVSPIFMHVTMNANGDVTSLKVEPPTVSCG